MKTIDDSDYRDSLVGEPMRPNEAWRAASSRGQIAGEVGDGYLSCECDNAFGESDGFSSQILQRPYCRYSDHLS